jgi:hypothetical protein
VKTVSYNHTLPCGLRQLPNEATSLRTRFERKLPLVLVLALAVCGQAFGMHRNNAVRRANLKHSTRRSHRHLRRILWNPMFRPSHDSLLLQNEEIDSLALPRIADDDELELLKTREELVPISASQTLRFDPRLDPNRRYCRPWARDFVQDLSEAYYREFHDQIQVNSAVRTVKVQHKLRRHNRNAAPEYGEAASSHLAGITLDLQRRGMSKPQIRFVERYLFYLKALGLVEPEEERHQWVFHVMVSERYSEWRQSQTMFPIGRLEQASTAQDRAE